jgi:hypothetical protein
MPLAGRFGLPFPRLGSDESRLAVRRRHPPGTRLRRVRNRSSIA